MGLGDHVERALALVGIDVALVDRWVGAPCGCPERRERLNQLGNWARRVVSGRVDRAREFFNKIVGPFGSTV